MRYEIYGPYWAPRTEAVLNEEPGQGRGRGIENRAEKAFMVRAIAFVQWIMEFAHAHFISIQPPLTEPEA